MADRTTLPADSAAALVLPLRSDPPWLRLGLLAVTLGSLALFTLYFRLLSSRPHPALALLPGLAVATFAGSALAWWGRRRGATLHLETTGPRVLLRSPRESALRIDRALPFGALRIADRRGAPQVLVLTQGSETLLLLDPQPSAAVPGRWQERSVALDLSAVALSPATAQVLTVAQGHGLDPLLAALESDLVTEVPRLQLALPSGESLTLTRETLRLGAREVALGAGAQARRLTLPVPHGEVRALSIRAGATELLLACQDPGGSAEGATPATAPDAWLPAVLFEAVAALFDLAPEDAATSSRPYRG
jgi:hypothetical protein